MNKVKGQASINLKLSEDLKKRTEEKADLKQQTVSKYIRELLSNYYDGSLCKNEIAKNERKEFINSTDFLQLVVWIYSKRKSNIYREGDKNIEKYIRTLKKVEEHLPANLVTEFDKVLSDIIRSTNTKSIVSKDYTFANGYHSTPEFNFEILEKYLLNFGTPIVIPSMAGLDFLVKPK
jgi:hypothetical protein